MNGALLFGNKDSVKSLVFAILAKEYPLKLIELHNLIKRRYGKSVTYQAVRKAVRELIEDSVLEERGATYVINASWVEETARSLNDIEHELRRGPRKARDHSTEDITVYEFPTLAALMRFWQEHITEWVKKRAKKGSTNYYQAPHAWEGLFEMERERELMESLVNRGVRSITVITGNTPLDSAIRTFYAKIGARSVQRPASGSFDRGYYVATYDDLVIQLTLPPLIIEALDKYFHSHRKLEELDLRALSMIVNRKTPVKLTLIRDAQMAKHVNNSIQQLVDS